MSQTSEPKVSTIKLDEATRARIAKELGFKAGLEAVPEEINIVGIDPKEAGLPDEDPEVEGFMQFAQTNNTFYSPAMTPTYFGGTTDSRAYQAPSWSNPQFSELTQRRAWNFVTVT
jgi:hypothetical protein